MTEAELLKFTTDALKWSGLVWFRVNNAPGIFMRGSQKCFKPSSMRGFPDLMGYRTDGVGWVMELKAPKGKVAEHQAECLKALANSNVNTCVARTREEVLTFIERMGGKVRALQK